MMRYSINDLKVFVRAAESPSLSGAARGLGITAAAVSAIVKRLEGEVGERLIERSSRACRLTEAGLSFQLAATRALEALREGESAIRQRSHALSGRVRLSAPTDLARGVLSQWLDEFQSRHPQLELAITLSDAVQDLVREAIDLAVRYGKLPDSTLVARPLLQTRRLTCAAPAYLERCGTPQTPADLARHNCLTYTVGGRREASWPYQTPGGLIRVAVQGDRSSDDSALVKSWAIAGRGLINKSDLDMLEDLESGRLVRVLDDFPGPVVPLSLVTGSRKLPANVQALATFLCERAAAVRERLRVCSR